MSATALIPHPAAYDCLHWRRHVRLTTHEGGRDVEREYRSGELVVIPPHVPHLFLFLNHTVMAEWWSPPGPFEARYYAPYRSAVDLAVGHKERGVRAAAKHGGRERAEPGDAAAQPSGPRERRERAADGPLGSG